MTRREGLTTGERVRDAAARGVLRCLVINRAWNRRDLPPFGTRRRVWALNFRIWADGVLIRLGEAAIRWNGGRGNLP